VVAIDPNMSDLLYCDGKAQVQFRYTRRKETKAKTYRDYQRVVEWEAELSAFNRKTTDVTKLRA
jgi:hypothetical protein